MRNLRHSTIGSSAMMAGALALVSCSALPELSEATGGIPLNDVVLRVKCELASAFQITPAGGTEYWLPNDPKFLWMQDWTAEIDLTLEILDTSTFAPGATWTEPFHNAYATTAGPSSISTAGVPGTSLGSISQNLTVAAGFSINGQASRTQTLSFAFSLAELNRWYSNEAVRASCEPSNGGDLSGRLGLKEWVAMIIEPIRGDETHPELLYSGHHPKPETMSKSPSAGTNPAKGPRPNPAVDYTFRQPKPEPICTPDLAKVDIEKAKKAIKDSDNEYTEILKKATNNWINKSTAEMAQIPTKLAAAKKDAPADLSSLNSKLKDTKPYQGSLEPATKTQVETDQSTAAAFNQNLALRSNIAIDAAKYANTDLVALPTLINDAKNADTTATTLADTKPRPETCAFRDDLRAKQSTLAIAIHFMQQAYSRAQTNIGKAEEAVASVNALIKDVTTATSNLQSIDPPISTFGQSVNFMVITSANVTPTWTFAKFKGPSTNLFSAGSTRTHTLNITVGSPTGSSLPTAISQNQLLLGINRVGRRAL